jgi:hypothetical protein
MQEGQQDLRLTTVEGTRHYVDPTSHTCCFRDAVNGTEVIVAGRRGAPGFADGASGDSRLSRPESAFIAPRSSETLFIVDAGNRALRRLDLRTGILATVAGTPPNASGADGGAAVWERWGPGVYVDGALAAMTCDGPAAALLAHSLTSGVHEWEVRRRRARPRRHRPRAAAGLRAAGTAARPAPPAAPLPPPPVARPPP